MKPFLNTHACWVSTLTPVHIGSGEDYYPTNYVIDDGVLYHFGETALAEALDGNELKQLAAFTDQRGDDGIKKLQAFIHGRKDKLREVAGHAVPVADGVAQLYAGRIGQTAQREGGGRNVQNQLAIQRSAYSPLTQTPYLPGSSLKGAMRTAILDFLNDGRPLPAGDQGTPNRPVSRYANGNLQQECLDYQAIPQDPLRLLKIGDATYHHPDGLHGLEVRFAVNRRREPGKNPSTRGDSGPPILLESLPAHRSRSFQMDIALHDAVADPKTGSRKTLPFRDIQELAKQCNDFYRPAFKQELDLLEDMNFGPAPWLSAIHGLLETELGKAFQDNRAFLLRVGKHSGAECVTLDGVRHIYIMPKKGQPPQYVDHTTTLWLAADDRQQQHGLLPFGWLLVELPGCELPETHAFLKQQAGRDYHLLQREKSRQDRAAQARIERERQQAEAERQAREKAEREAADKARLASLSEIGRQAEAFRQRMDKEGDHWVRQGVGAQWFQDLRKLAESASTAAAEDKAAVLALVQTVSGLSPNFLPKKNDKIKAWLRSLSA